MGSFFDVTNWSKKQSEVLSIIEFEKCACKNGGIALK